MPSDEISLETVGPLSPIVAPADLPLLNFLGRLEHNEDLGENVHVFAAGVREFFGISERPSLRTLKLGQAIAAKTYVVDALEPIADGFLGMDKAEVLAEATNLLRNRAVERGMGYWKLLRSVGIPTDSLQDIATNQYHRDDEVTMSLAKGISKYPPQVNLSTAALKESGMQIRWQIVDEELAILNLLRASSEKANQRRGLLRPLFQKFVGVKLVMESSAQSV